MTDEGSEESSGASPMGWWDLVLEELEARVAAYQEEGWEALALHPGDVTPVDADQSGLDILVPDDEFAALQSVLEPADTDSYDVYRTTVDHYVVGLVALSDTDRQVAVLFPVYYATGDDAAKALFERALPAEELTVWLRVLSGDRIELTLEDPKLLAPPAVVEDSSQESRRGGDADPPDSGP